MPGLQQGVHATRIEPPEARQRGLIPSSDETGQLRAEQGGEPTSKDIPPIQEDLMTSAPQLTRPSAIIEPLPDPFEKRAHDPQPADLWDTPVAVGPLSYSSRQLEAPNIEERSDFGREAAQAAGMPGTSGLSRRTAGSPNPPGDNAAFGKMYLSLDAAQTEEPGGVAGEPENLKEPLVSPVGLLTALVRAGVNGFL